MAISLRLFASVVRSVQVFERRYFTPALPFRATSESVKHSRDKETVFIHRNSAKVSLLPTKRHFSSTAVNMNTLDSVVTKLKTLAPLSLAGNWDNVGLLVEPSPPKYISKVMLTNDLTAAVMEEAKDKTVDLIISYHPPIFVPLKRLTQRSWKERMVVECMENRIAVFSPHTSYDAVEGGVNDWLLSAFDVKKGSICPVEVHQEFSEGRTHALEIDMESARLKEIRDQTLMTHLPPGSRLRKNKEVFSMHSVKAGSSSGTEQWRLRVEGSESEITDMVKGLLTCGCREKYSITQLAKIPWPSVGMGRKAELSAPLTLKAAIAKVKGHLDLKNVSVAQAPGKEETEIETVAVCAGSGSSVLRGVSADLLVTGEMSHHEILDAVHRGSHVILCHHSNTERGYLKHLKDKLAIVLGNAIEIFVSETDKDPLEIV